MNSGWESGLRLFCRGAGLRMGWHGHTGSRTIQGLGRTCVFAGMSPASVTLASALQVRGEALSEEEIWSLLSLAAERLLEDLCDGKRVCLGQLRPRELNVKLPKQLSDLSSEVLD